MNITEKKVVEIINNVEPSVEINELTFGETLSEIGLDSLDIMSILLNVQEAFELPEIQDDEIDELNTLDKIVAYIHAQQDASA